MKSSVLLLILSLLICNISCDTSETIIPKNEVFIKLYGNDGNQYGIDLLQLDEANDKDLVLLARVEGITNHFSIIKVDTLGKELFSLEFEDDNLLSSENAVAMAMDNQSNIYVYGTAVMPNPLDNDLFVYKISPSGQLLAHEVYGISLPYNSGSPADKPKRIDIAQDIISFANNTFVVSGYTKASQNAPEEFFSYRFDENFNKIEINKEVWQFSDSENQNPFSRMESKILSLDDNSVIAFVSSNNKNEFSPDGYNIERLVLNELNDPGIEFQDSGTDFNDKIAGAVKTNNGFAYIATIQKSTENAIFIGQYSSTASKLGLEMEWSHRNLQAIDINQQIPGRFLILAEETITTDNNNIYLAEVEGGRIVWEQSYGGSEIDQAAGLLVDGNSIYVLGTLEFDDQLNSQKKVLLIKTDMQGKL